MNNSLLASKLFDERTFYQTFLNDLKSCQNEIFIESPFITTFQMKTFDRVFQKLLNKGIKINIVTRDPKEHDESLEVQSEDAIRWCEENGIHVLICSGNHHRRLAILDRKILWEGNLNILSQAHSRENVRKVDYFKSF